MDRTTKLGVPGIAVATLVTLSLVGTPTVQAQTCQHGASIFKTCQSPKRKCNADAQCNDQLECTNDVCDLSLSNLTNCVITLANADTCGDTTKITQGFDVEDFGGDNVRVPAVGSLPIDSINGNAVCCAGPTLPCFVGPAGSTFIVPAIASGCGNLPLPGSATAGSVAFRQNTYVVQPNDPDPLPDQGTVSGNDLCNAGAMGCSTGPVSVQFGAGTDLVSGCVNQNKPDSTPCTDSDGNACTTAGCEVGQCVQAHVTTTCQPDSNECTNDLACDPTTGQCPHPPKPDSTPCTDSDGNACTTAGCEVGQCVQAHVTTTCQPDSNECTNDLACDPTTGQCPHPPKPDSTPCTDSDGNACTTAGCEVGECVQTHVTTTCQPDSNDCTQDLACNPATGACNHPPKPDSTPCGDTDQNACTTAGCEAGQCVQTHVSTTCPPDSNECTLDPPCNPATGQCTHPPAADSTPCTDTDSNACTAAGCESGQCVQSHIETCETPDHFQCYEIKPKAFVTVTGVSVQDQFGQHTETVRLAHRLCAPANKNGEDPSAPTHPEHLQGHIVSGPNVKVANLTVANQFGTIKLDIVKPDVLMVPTLKTLALPGPGPLANPTVDHFQCYKAKRSKGSPKFQKVLGVTVQDQFGTATLDLLKPIRLCAPANKRNEDPSAPSHLFHLLCYKTKNSAFGTVQTYTNDQFGPGQPLLIHRRELCVPSTKNGAAPPTTTTSTPATTTTSSTAPVPTTTTTSSTTTTTVMSPSGAFLDEPVDLIH